MKRKAAPNVSLELTRDRVLKPGKSVRERKAAKKWVWRSTFYMFYATRISHIPLRSQQIICRVRLFAS